MLLRFPNSAPQLPWGIPDVQNGDYYVLRNGWTDKIQYVHPRAMNEGAVLAMVTPAQAGLRPREVLGDIPSADAVEQTITGAAQEVVQTAQGEQERIVTTIQEQLPADIELPPMPSFNMRQVGVMGLIALGALLTGGILHRMGV